LQKLWNLDYTWDTALSKLHADEWEKVVRNLDGFEICISRCVAELEHEAKLILFADASRQCMATCAYLLSNNHSFLLMGNSKLQSSNYVTTIPKLELNAVTVAVRLAYSIRTALKNHISIQEILIMSDSEIALSWLRSPNLGKSVGVLVKNRIKEIRRIDKALHILIRFAHVPADQNPADCATKGLSKSHLKSHYWWTGPNFIRESDLSKNINLFGLPQDAEKNCNYTVMATFDQPDLELLDWSRHNRLITAQNAVAYVLRFLKKVTTKLKRKLRERIRHTIPELELASSESYITAIEYEAALRMIIRNHQRYTYPGMEKRFLQPFSIVKDQHGFFCCKGRLNKANIPFEERQPILIQTKTRLAEIIVSD
ncbi:hypothetical protein Angca_002038, partial [Angiostrongylus cantonensis]